MTDPASPPPALPSQAPAPDGADRFADDWLDLRESIDHRSRAQAAVERQLPSRARWRALDLGGGTGSNLRYLMPRLGGEQHWWLIDHDPQLLAGAGDRLVRWALDQGFGCEVDGEGPGSSGQPAVAPAAVPPSRRRWTRIDLDGPGWRATVEPRRIDLERLDFLDALSGEDDAIDLVTASALLDLVSIEWLAKLVDWCAARRTAILFALSYDGRVRWSPPWPDDDAVTAALEGDQRRDKGMGVALGSAAVDRLRSRLVARGLTEVAAPSDWVLEATGVGAAVQRRLINDWAALAGKRLEGEVGPDGLAVAATRWKAGRLALLDAGMARLRVGHIDVAAWPASGSTRPAR